jgi:hypothetical protein
MITPSLTITANIQSIFGANYPKGTPVFQLENYGSSVPRVISTGFVVSPRVTATADINGLISTLIWGNDLIAPSGTYYLVTFMSDKNLQTAQCRYSLVGSGTVDLSTLTPF